MAAKRLKDEAREKGDGELRAYLPSLVVEMAQAIITFDNLPSVLTADLVDRVLSLYFTRFEEVSSTPGPIAPGPAAPGAPAAPGGATTRPAAGQTAAAPTPAPAAAAPSPTPSSLRAPVAASGRGAPFVDAPSDRRGYGAPGPSSADVR